MPNPPDAIVVAGVNQGCTDPATLDRWVDNVLGAKKASDVLS
ncbi:hypothetical protein [Sorangium sp. So ce1078]